MERRSCHRRNRNALEHWPWFKVYDIAEAIYSKVESEIYPRGLSDFKRQRANQAPQLPQTYQGMLYQVMSSEGIGWQMVNGKFEIRGELAQQALNEQADKLLGEYAVAQKELREAFSDL